METIFLDGRRLARREEAHNYLSTILSLPDYYGRNLDALWDLMTEWSRPTRLVVCHLEAMGVCGEAILGTLEDAAAENPLLQVERLDE